MAGKLNEVLEAVPCGFVWIGTFHGLEKILVVVVINNFVQLISELGTGGPGACGAG